MGQLKTAEVDRYIANLKKDIKLFLIYGPDTGLVSERADLLAVKTGVDLKDAFTFIRLDADNAAAEPGKIADEANTVSMFGGERLIRLSGTTRRDLSKSLKPLLEASLVDTWIIVESGDLKKTSPIRKLFEASPNALALPCYQDNDAALNHLINQELEQNGLTLESDTKLFLKNRLGADRRASRNELQKLALYASGQSSVTLDDIKTIVGDTSQTLVDELLDAASTGQTNRLDELYNKSLNSGVSADQLMVFTLKYFQTLHQARAKVENERLSPAAVIGSIRPPIHFSRKNAVTKALGLWKLSRLNKSLERLNEASFQCRSNAEISKALASTTFLAIALEAKAAASQSR